MSKYEFDFQKQPGKVRTRYYAPDPKDALVSVITPYYNAGKYFEQTFNSVMNQTFPWFEWIIVDDGSPNQADVELLHSFARKDDRITVFTQKNAGPSKARNTAIELAHTDLVVTLDADDLIDPTYLECLYWSLRYNPDVAWSYSNSYGFQEQEYIWKYPFSAEIIKTYNFLNYTAMIRKKDIIDIGGYKIEKQAYHEDWRFWLDMLSMSKKPVRINSFLFWYRRLSSGRLSSVNNDKKLTEDCDRIIKTAAETVDINVQPLIYPVKNSQYPYYKPKFETWSIRTFNEHKQKRVLWLIPWMMMGGADKFNLDAIAGLRKRGFQNFVLATQQSENEWRQRFEDYADEIFVLPDFLDPAHYLEFVSYFIQTRDIDVIMLSNSYDGYYMMPWIRQHFPSIAIVDYVHMEEWYWRAGGYARTAGVLSGIVEKTYVCNSLTQKVICEKFNRKSNSVDCLYIGVDHKQFSREQEAPGYLHSLLDLSEERKVVLFPCRIHPQKRPFMMLDIAEGVRSVLPDIAFVVVGDGPLLEELKEQINTRNLKETVYCIGATEQMRACYRDSDLTLICSLKEGLALTAYESCSMGVPVVSADVGGQGDLIDMDVGALLPLRQKEVEIDLRTYDPEEVEDYVKYICRILQDNTLYNRLSQKCRQKIEEGFTIEKMVETLAQELTEACTNETRRIQRRAVSAALSLMDNLAADYYTIYQQWGIQRDESTNLWEARCWFKNLWEEKSRECDEIWQSRCYFEQKYQEVSGKKHENFSYKCYRKIRCILGKLYRKVFKVF